MSLRLAWRVHRFPSRPRPGPIRSGQSASLAGPLGRPEAQRCPAGWRVPRRPEFFRPHRIRRRYGLSASVEDCPATHRAARRWAARGGQGLRKSRRRSVRYPSITTLFGVRAEPSRKCKRPKTRADSVDASEPHNVRHVNNHTVGNIAVGLPGQSSQHVTFIRVHPRGTSFYICDAEGQLLQPFANFFSIFASKDLSRRHEAVSSGLRFLESLVSCIAVVNGLKSEILGIYDAFFRKIYSYLVYRLYTPELAEDATSAVFTTLVEQFPCLGHKSQEEIQSWLYGIASNVAASYLSDARRQDEIRDQLSKIKETVGASSMRHVDWPVLYQAIGRLTRTHQELVTLRFFQELSTAEIAAAMDMRKARCESPSCEPCGSSRRSLGARSTVSSPSSRAKLQRRKNLHGAPAVCRETLQGLSCRPRGRWDYRDGDVAAW